CSLGALFLLNLTIELFLEEAYDDQVPVKEDANSQETRLFDKSKLNIYWDSNMLVDILLDQLQILAADHWHHQPKNEADLPIDHIKRTLDLISKTSPAASIIMDEIMPNVDLINRFAVSAKRIAKSELCKQELNHFEKFLVKLCQVISTV